MTAKEQKVTFRQTVLCLCCTSPHCLCYTDPHNSISSQILSIGRQEIVSYLLSNGYKGKERMKKVSDDKDDDFEPPTKCHCSASKAILSEIKGNLASVFKLSASMKNKLPLGISPRHSSVKFAAVSP